MLKFSVHPLLEKTVSKINPDSDKNLIPLKIAPNFRERISPFSIPAPDSHHGVAMLALLRSSHSHICLGNGYSVVEVHGGSLEAPLTFPLPNFFRIFPLLFKIFSFKLVNYKKPSLCRAFSKFPSLGRQREGQKINPLEKFFCFGSKLEPFSYAGLLVAPKWSHFSSMASKLMPCPFRISSVWLQN